MRQYLLVTLQEFRLDGQNTLLSATDCKGRVTANMAYALALRRANKRWC